jgi:hypothetical protein
MKCFFYILLKQGYKAASFLGPEIYIYFWPKAGCNTYRVSQKRPIKGIFMRELDGTLSRMKILLIGDF